MIRRPAVLAGAAVALAAALGAMAACGVPIDDEPRVIERAATPSSTQPATTVADGGDPERVELGVYFLRDDTLERQAYPAPSDPPALADAIHYALEAPAEGSDPDLRTSVPPGTRLRSAEVTDGVASIDLSDEMNDIAGTAQKEAFAQLAFTALDFGGVRQVRFLIDGEVIDAPTDDGNVDLVAADDYGPPLAPR